MAVVGIIVAILVIWAILTYNTLVKARNKAQEAEAGIDAHLTERYDLIPNIVETVKGYAKHESATLENVIKARNSAISANGLDEKDKADGNVTTALKSLFALSESYPDLKANQNFLSLQEQLGKIEKDLLNSRKYYNATVRDYNDRIMRFPCNLLASIFKFKKLDYVKAEDSARTAPKVSF